MVSYIKRVNELIQLDWLKCVLAFVAGAMALLIVQYVSMTEATQPRVLSAVEEVELKPASLGLLARVDTGAATSSISAQQIEIYKKQGQDWVSFVLSHSTLDETLALHAPLVRYAQVRQASQPEPVMRPVVVLSVELQGEVLELEFSLTDRAHLNYPLLLGRNLIGKGWLVDINRR